MNSPSYSVAFVESPLQFLSALEAHTSAISPARATGEGQRRAAAPAGLGELLIVARSQAKGMTSFLDAFDLGWLPDNVRVEREGAKHRILRDRPPERIYLGDPCSGQMHKALSLAYLERRLPEVVILDDGLATYSTIDILSSPGGPLIRARQTLKPSRRIIAAYVADRLRGLAASGRLSWHTALPVPDALAAAFTATGAGIATHRFDFLQTLPTGGSHPRDNPVIGSSLAADGLISEARYREWLEAIIDLGPITYYPHRRETDEFLSALGTDPRVRIKHVGLPIELRLVNLPAESTIRSLPSTAVVSLTVLNPDVTIDVTEIPADWWTGAAPDSLRTSLNSQTLKAAAS
ncbi:hypothetical protein [Brevibacterium sp.]|uniref:hypothetical protein n=1 Tax=Brevibacterium sp. TaxID=1701 RepID=UPI00281220C9|nr:hypothetical protein [Brevibacterium sp.]